MLSLPASRVGQSVGRSVGRSDGGDQEGHGRYELRHVGGEERREGKETRGGGEERKRGEGGGGGGGVVGFASHHDLLVSLVSQARRSTVGSGWIYKVGIMGLSYIESI